MTRFRLFFAALIAAAAIAACPGLAQAQEPAGGPQAHETAPAAAARAGDAASHEGRTAAGHDSWAPVIAKAVNFAILISVLVYFLRAPLMGYLNGRIGKVREDLITAAETRKTASRQLAEIEAKLAALPADIEALKRRGAEDLAAERVRIEQVGQ